MNMLKANARFALAALLLATLPGCPEAEDPKVLDAIMDSADAHGKADITMELPDLRQPDQPDAQPDSMLADLEVRLDLSEDVPDLADGELQLPENCGDGACKAAEDETCQTCPVDCGKCTVCGNGLCELGTPPETPTSCAPDCGHCGDGTCSMAELNPDLFCYWDCATTCGDGICDEVEGDPDTVLTFCLLDCSDCDDGFCGMNEVMDPQFADCMSADCGGDCGDGICGVTESEEDCPVDCGLCGDGICAKVGDIVENCPMDCVQPCGDGICYGLETAESCAMDCGDCGDGVCGIAEMKLAFCPADCPEECGDGKCEDAEDDVACPADCGCLPVCEPEWQCGEDANGCGQPCGACPEGIECIDRACCVPECVEKDCGPDGCGGNCGICDDDENCIEGVCYPVECVPSCAVGECGNDGCGGQCPPCDDGLECTLDVCVDGLCDVDVLPTYCLLDGQCVPSGTQSADSECSLCKPLSSQSDWSWASQFIPCGDGGVCFDGACCPKTDNCTNKQCGTDDCGGNCGSCPAKWDCINGQCVEPVCNPECAGMECGSDGCGGQCGSCSDGLNCTSDQCTGGKCTNPVLAYHCLVTNAAGTQSCVISGFDDPDNDCFECRPNISAFAYSPGNNGAECEIIVIDQQFNGVCWQGECCLAEENCEGKECGDDGCGGKCGYCKPDQFCEGGLCKQGACVPQCAGKQCGDDGCGGDCGFCQPGWNCQAGECIEESCSPDCTGKECGSDGCEGDCGTCAGNEQCQPDGTCCEPGCGLSVCGPDQCGGTCGSCDGAEECHQGNCLMPCDDGNTIDWDGCTDGFSSPLVAVPNPSFDIGSPAVAAFDVGRFVLVFAQLGDLGTWDIFGIIYDVDGTPLTEPFLINENTSGTDLEPFVVTHGEGEFTVVWENASVAPGVGGIWARRFNDLPQPVTSAVQVLEKLDNQYSSVGALDLGNGNTIIAFDNSVGSDGADVMMRTYNSNLVPQDSLSKANTYTNNDQLHAQLALLPGNGYLITWTSCPDSGGPYSPDGQDGSGCGVFGRRFALDGTPMDPVEFQINLDENGVQDRGGAAALTGSQFAAVWRDNDYAKSEINILLRLFNGGVGAVATLQVNSLTMDQEHRPAISAAPAGDFVVSWVHEVEDVGDTIYLQRFDNQTNPLGLQTQVDYWAGAYIADLSMDHFPDGSFVLAWKSCGLEGPSQDGHGCSIMLERFNAGGQHCVKDQCVTGTVMPPVCPGGCDDDNPCTDDHCGKGVCKHTNNINPCDNGDACTADDACFAGGCKGGTPKDCDDGNPCTDDECNPLTGECFNDDNYENCDDGDVCTSDDHCDGGVCSGAAIVCSDGNACNGLETCDPALGCQPSAPLFCDDGNECTADFCSPISGCVNMPTAEGGPCAGGTCVAGVCVPSGGECDDSNAVDWDGCTGKKFSEFIVNTTTANSQMTPRVAVGTEGDFVIIWESEFQDGDQFGVYLQGYNKFGVPDGEEEQVNLTTDGNQRHPQVAHFATGGGYLVAWEDHGQGSAWDVMARLVDGSFSPTSEELMLNTTAAGDQMHPAILAHSTGQFRVAWSDSTGLDGHQTGIVSQLFTPAGNPQGITERVENTDVDGDQHSPVAALLPWDEFALAWVSNTADTSPPGLIVRTYDDESTPWSNDIVLNATTIGPQQAVDLAPLAHGLGLVAVWESDHGPTGKDVMGQLVNYKGLRSGPEFMINSHLAGDQDLPSVAGLASGGFVVFWRNADAGGPGEGIVGQRFDVDGNPVGGEFRANLFLDVGEFGGPDVGAVPGGGFVVTWANSMSQDGSGWTVLARRYSEDGSSCTNVDCMYAAAHTCPGGCDDAGFCTVDFCNTASGQCAHALLDLMCIDSNPCTTNYCDLNTDSCKYTANNDPCDDHNPCTTNDGCFDAACLGQPVPCDNGNPCEIGTCSPVVGCEWTPANNGAPCYLGGSCLDGECNVTGGVPCDDGNAIDWDGCTGGEVSEFLVNETTAGQQSYSHTAFLSNGGFVVVWQGDDTDGFGVLGRVFNADGTPLTGEFPINTTTVDNQMQPRVVGLDSGFLVVWLHQDLNTLDYDIYGRRFVSNGNPSGTDFIVNTTTDGNQLNGWPIYISDGTHIIVWDGEGPGDTDGIFGQLYDADGNELGGEVLLSQSAEVTQYDPSGSMMLTPEGFIVAWTASPNADGNGSGAFARAFLANGTPLPGGEVLLNATTVSNQYEVSQAFLSPERFVASWTDKAADGDGAGVFARIFANSGQAQTTELQVNTTTAGEQSSSSAAAFNFEAGRFVVAYQAANLPGGTSYDIAAQMYNTNGQTYGPEFRLNDFTTSSQWDPTAAFLPAGGFVVAWTSGQQDGSSEGIFARMYDGDGTPCMPGECPTPGGDDCPGGCDDGVDCTMDACVPGMGCSHFPNDALCADGNDCTFDICNPFLDCENPPVEDNDVCDGGHCQGGVCVPDLVECDDGNGINWDGCTNGSFSEFQVNEYTTADQENPAVAALPEGGFVVVYESFGQDLDMDGVFAKVYDDDGIELDGEFRASLVSVGSQTQPDVAALANGNIVVVWENMTPMEQIDVMARIMTTDPVIVKEDFVVHLASNKYQGDPSVTALPNNEFLVAFTDSADADGFSVSVARFDAAGDPVWPKPLPVNSFPTSDQWMPSVAASPDGEFTIVWQSQGQDWPAPPGAGVFGQRFEVDGPKDGSEFRCNTFPMGDQGNPVLVSAGSNFSLAVWDSDYIDGSEKGVFVRSMDSTGAFLGPERNVNAEYQDQVQELPSIAAHPTGKAVVTWSGIGPPGLSAGVFVQRITQVGELVGDIFHANQFMPVDGGPWRNDVAMFGDAGYVVVWESKGQDGSGRGVYALRFNTDGSICGLETCKTSANTCPNGCDDQDPCTMDTCDEVLGCQFAADDAVCDDGYACTDDSCAPGVGCEHAEKFCDDGDKCTDDYCDSETGLCGTTPFCDDSDLCTTDVCDPVTGDCDYFDKDCDDGDHCTADVCSPFTGECAHHSIVCDDADPCTVDWCDETTGMCDFVPKICDDGDDCTQNQCNPATGQCQYPPNLELCNGVDDNCNDFIDEGFPDTDHDNLANCVDADDDNDGVPDLLDCQPLNPTVPSCAGKECGNDGCGGSCGTCAAGKTCTDGVCVQGSCSPSCQDKECGDDGCSGVCGTCASGKLCNAAQTCSSFTETCDDGNAVDWDGCTNGVATEFQVNGYEPNDQDASSVATHSWDGSFVVAWHTDTMESVKQGIFLRKFDKDGATVGSEVQVNDNATALDHRNPDVMYMDDNTIVVAWTGPDTPGAGTHDIYFKWLDTDLSTLHATARLNSNTSNNQWGIQIGPSMSGAGFRGVFTNDSLDGDLGGVYSRLASGDGDPLTSDARLNIATSGDQKHPIIAGMPDGTYEVAIWADFSAADAADIERRLIPSGVPDPAEAVVNTITDNVQQNPAAAIIMSVGYVVTWESKNQDGSGWGIYARVFDEGGFPYNSDFVVNDATSGHQVQPAVAADYDGYFVIAFAGPGAGAPDAGIFLQKYDLWVATGTNILANRRAVGSNANPDIAMFPDSSAVVTWTASDADGDGSAIMAVRLKPDLSVCPLSTCDTVF